MLKKIFTGLIVAGIHGCSGDSSSVLGSKNADVFGEVQQVIVAADGSGEVRLAIRGRGPDGSVNGTLFLLVNPGTPISVSAKPGAHTGSASDLVVGALVAANVSAEIIDTFPPQYTATEIQLESSD